jgi:glycosyltransferase involved in cell wall biosynthesis
MRVLHVQKVKGIGGSERHLLSLLPALRDTGTDVAMAVIASDEADRFVEQMRATGVPVQVLEAPRSPLSLGLALDIGKAINRYRPDLMHTHLIHADVHGQVAARRAGVRGVSSIHSVEGFYRREPYRSVARFAHRLATRTIAISRFAGEYIVRAGVVRSERLRVVPYGIEVMDWVLSNDDRLAARRELGVDREDVVVGIAARLTEGKGHADAIEAVDRISREIPQVRLMIAGEGPLRGQLEAAAREVPNDRVRLVGFVQDVPRFMSAVDVVCFPTQPSLGEGFGLAALEGMASSRPVVATAVAALPEVVLDGETGLLVPAGDVGALARALGRLAVDMDERTRMGLAGHGRAGSTFSLDAMVRRTNEVYQGALG